MLSGIYKITSIVNNKIYIGSSSNIRKRFGSHIRELKLNTHHNVKLQNCWNKYGEQNFIYTVIEWCNINDLLNKENYYLKTLNPELNISKDAFSVMLNRKHSEETKNKFKNRVFLSGKEHHFYGKKLPKEQIQKMIIKRTGLKRSKETRLKMSNTAKRLNSISRIDRDKSKRKIIDSNNNIFNSLTDAANYYNISIQAICDNLKGRSIKTRIGITFKYV